MPKLFVDDIQPFYSRLGKFKHLKHICTDKLFSQSTNMNENTFKDTPIIIPKRPNLKSMTIKKGNKSGWYPHIIFLMDLTLIRTQKLGDEEILPFYRKLVICLES